MKKYFCLKNGQQIGPFTYDELWNQQIAANTMVWYEGMQNWQEAYLLPEFVNWFPKGAVVQPIAAQQMHRPQQVARPIMTQATPKKSYRGLIGVVVFFVGILIIYSFWLQANPNAQSSTTKQVTSEKKNSGSTNTNNHLVGNWKMIDGSFMLQFAFSRNNKGTLTTTEDGESDSVRFSYSIRGNQMTIKWPDETDVTTFSVSGNKLSIIIEGRTLIFRAN